MLHKSIVLPTGRHTASVIFLHGSGDTGVGIQSWIEECFNRVGDKQGFNFKHIKVIYPTAPPQPYTPLNGRQSNVWFDREKLSVHVPDIVTSIDKMTPKISEIIQAEVNSGIPPSRIIVGGFSMGGGMSLHIGYRAHSKLRGIFALSSFLNGNSPVYDAVRARQSNSDATMPELFMAHGTRDELVLYEWGKQTFDKLQSLGVKGRFHELNYYHEIGTQELVTLRDWVMKLLPDNTKHKL